MRRLGDFLATARGLALIVAIALGLTWLRVYTDIGAWGLDLLSLVFPALIIVRDHAHNQIMGERDKALHAKLDELIAAIPDADNQLAGSEPDEPDQ